MQENKSPNRQYIEELKNLQSEVGGSPTEIKQLAVHLLATIVELTSKGSPLTITQTETGIKLDVYEAGAPRYDIEYPFPNAQEQRYSVVPQKNSDTTRRCKTEWGDELATRVEIAASRLPEKGTLEEFFRKAKIKID